MEKTTNYAPSINRVSGLMIFFLVAMLAVFSLIAVMLGIQIYNNVVTTAESNSAVRTSLAYVSTKIRANDEAGMVELRNIDGLDVIVLGADRDGTIYNTYIYYTDGALREYYANAENDFNPIYGTVIAKVSRFEMSLDGNLFCFTTVDEEGVSHDMHVYIHSEQGRGRAA